MDWLFSALPTEIYYNVTFHFSVLSCDKSHSDLPEDLHDQNTIDSSVEDSRDEVADNGLLDFIMNFFSGSKVVDNLETSYSDEQDSETEVSVFHDSCISVMNFNSSQITSLLTLSMIFVTIMTVMAVILIWLMAKLYKSKHEISSIRCTNHESLVDETVKSINISSAKEHYKKCTEDAANLDEVNPKQMVQPLVIHNPKINLKNSTSVEQNAIFESMFEETVDILFKELDQSLGIEFRSQSDGGDAGTSLPTFSSYNAATLTSPILVRRGLRHNRHSTKSLTGGSLRHREASEAAYRYWISFQKFRKQMLWVYPDINIDCINFQQISHVDNRLSRAVQFLHQRCSIRPRQWNVATYVVDYILFLLGHELAALSDESDEFLKFIRFEGTGSAADGTLTGAADRFDVLLVVNISTCSEMKILFHNFCEGIPAGHVVLGMTSDGSANQPPKCSRRAGIQGLSGFYFVPRQIEELVEALVKKAALKLHTEHKSRTDRLPFKFQVSSNNSKVVLNIDTRLLHELGLGISEINVKVIPAICLSVPQFDFLPPLYAVPLHRYRNSENSSTTFLSRIVQDQGHSDLLWEISTERLWSSIIHNIENKFILSGVRSFHRECLMILKALFAKGNESSLLNKGEIDICVLNAVASFLLQESPSSAWTLDNLPDRISDAVHFLKSAYQNIRLPKFVVHNPHLISQIPSLEMMSSLLSGKQQNLLEDVCNDAALKVTEYIDRQLQETGLNRCMKPQFSDNMLEYEFFVYD